MRVILCQLEVESVTGRADGSVTVRARTPELDDQERAALIGLAGQEVKALLQTVDGPPRFVQVETQFGKSPSERLRGVLWALWVEQGSQGGFDAFYHERMDRLTGWVKKKLKGKQ